MTAPDRSGPGVRITLLASERAPSGEPLERVALRDDMDATVGVLLEAVRLALGQEAALQLVGQAKREGVPRASARGHAQGKASRPGARGLVTPRAGAAPRW